CARARGAGLGRHVMKTDQSYTDNNFTVLRLVLALMVVLGHFQLLRGVHHPPWPFNYAAMAVDCFFVASGYLVSSSFDRDSDLGRFYIRRFFRIYPLYIAVVAAQTAIFAVLVPGGAWQNLKSLGSYFVANAAFANFLQYDVGSGVLHGMVNPALNPSLWTLKIEFGFYLLLPFLWRATERWGVKVLVGVFVLSAAYYVGLNSADNYLLAKQLPGELQFFVLGIAAYRYRGHVKLGPRWGLIATIALALLCTALLQTLTPVVYPLAVGALVVAAALTAPRIRMKRDISYGVYLLHGPIIQLSLLFGIYRADWIGLAATLLAVILLACGVERIIEVPGIALGRKLSRRVGSEKAMPRRAQPASLHVLPSAAPPRASSAAAASGLVVVVLNDFCHVQGGASKVAIDEAVGLARHRHLPRRGRPGLARTPAPVVDGRVSRAERADRLHPPSRRRVSGALESQSRAAYARPPAAAAARSHGRASPRLHQGADDESRPDRQADGRPGGLHAA